MEDSSTGSIFSDANDSDVGSIFSDGTESESEMVTPPSSNSVFISRISNPEKKMQLEENFAIPESEIAPISPPSAVIQTSTPNKNFEEPLEPILEELPVQRRTKSLSLHPKTNKFQDSEKSILECVSNSTRRRISTMTNRASPNKKNLRLAKVNIGLIPHKPISRLRSKFEKGKKFQMNVKMTSFLKYC